jgi:hypothetical protein
MTPAVFEIKMAYGQVRAYPVGKIAQAAVALAGSKTLKPDSILHLRELGIDPVTPYGRQIQACELS